MNAERFRQVEELYHSARERDPEGRSAFLAEACGSDEELRRGVESLLADRGADAMLDRHPAGLIENSTVVMLAAGTRLGPYKIAAPIGAGGMGQVFRATDTRLRRDVALKVVSPEYALDRQWLSRFQREARVLASLNHPQIAAIYGIEESDGVYAIAMELVEGPTLAERLARGRIPVAESLPIAMHIAEALEYAHEKGVVHRDLKPANVKLRPDGVVKVLDFGLAKTTEADTAPSRTATRPGIVMGTPAYMAPEQAAGLPADRRVDIWAFGVVLFEMLSGRRVYARKSAAETLAAVTRDDPPWNDLPAETPAPIRSLLRRCLDRDPKNRLRDMGEARIAIGLALAGETPGSEGAARTKGREWLWIAPVAAALIVAAFVLGHVTRTPAPAVTVRFSFAPSSKSRYFDTAVSPDGSRIVYADFTGLWMRSIDSPIEQKLPGTNGAIRPFWSPDGRSLGFVVDGTAVKRLDFNDGQTSVRSLTSFANYGGAAWSPLGVIIYQPEQTDTGLLQIPADGGTAVPATRLNSARKEIRHRYPQFLPDGRHFIYWVWSAIEENNGIYVGSLDAKEKLPEGPLVRTWREARYAEPGYLLFFEGTTLMARRFDASALRFDSDARPLADQPAMNWFRTGMASLSVSPSGALAYQEALPQAEWRLAIRNREGALLRSVGTPSGSTYPSLDPEGKQVVLNGEDENAVEELWKVDLTRGVTSRLTAAHVSNQFPQWSPDGRLIAFCSNRDGVYDLYAKDASGVGDEELLVKSAHMKIANGWSGDGRYLVYHQFDPVTKPDLWVLPLFGDRKPFPFLRTPFSEYFGVFSPVTDQQGRLWMAYTSDETGSPEIYLRPLVPAAQGGSAGAKVRVSVGGGNRAAWRKDGKELFYFQKGQLMAVDVGLGATAEVGTPHKLFDHAGGSFAVFPDGKSFLFIEPAGELPPARINVTLNWSAGLKRQ